LLKVNRRNPVQTLLKLAAFLLIPEKVLELLVARLPPTVNDMWSLRLFRVDAQALASLPAIY